MGRELKEQLKKILAVILSICMVCTLNPVSALAQGTRDKASTPISEGTSQDDMVYEESGAGVSKTPTQVTFGEDGTASASTHINVKVIDTVKLTNVSEAYATSGSVQEVSGATLKAELTGASASDTFYYEWTRGSRAVGTSDQFANFTVLSGAGVTGTLTGSTEYKNLTHAVSGEFTNADDGKEFLYTLNVYRGNVATGTPDYSISFDPIAITNKYVRYTFTGPDATSGPVTADVLALKTPTGTVSKASDSTKADFVDKAKDEGKTLLGDVYTVTVGTNGDATTDPAYTSIYSLKFALDKSFVDGLADEQSLKVIGTLEDGAAFDSGDISKTDIREDASGNHYIILEGANAPSKLGTFAVIYTSPIEKVRLTINIEGTGTVAVSPTDAALAGMPNTYEFAKGTKVTITPNPGAGYVLESATSTGDVLTQAGNTYTLDMTQDTNVSVKFKEAQVTTTHTFRLDMATGSLVGYSPTVTGLDSNNSDMTGSFELGHTYNVQEGTKITITFNAGSNTVKLTDTSGNVVSTGPTYDFTLGQNTTYTVKYEEKAPDVHPPIKVTLNTDNNGTLGVAPGQTGGSLDSWKWGVPLTLNVTPNAGYRLATITYDDGSGAKDASAWLEPNHTQLNVPASHTKADLAISATFVLDDVHVTLATADNTSNGGSLSATSGSSTKTGIGTHVFKYGDDVIVSAKPKENFTLSSIEVKRGNTTAVYTATGEDKFTADGNGAYTVDLGNVTGSVTATATFTPVTPEVKETVIVVTTEGEGTVEPAGPVRVPKGQSFTFAFKPGGTNKSAEVYENGSQTAKATNVTSYTVKTTDASPDTMSLHVKFKGDTPQGGEVTETYEIKASAGPGGAISPSGTVTPKKGQSQSFSITADSGYVISQVLVNGSEQTDATDKTTYTLTLSSAATVTVSFKKVADTEEDYYTLVVKPAEHGKVTPTGTQRLVEGSIQTITFEPDKGYELGSVLVNNTDRTTDVANGTLTLSITADTTVTTTFTKKSSTGDTPIDPPARPVAKAVSAFTRGGNISPTGERSVYLDTDGMFLTYTMTPEAGYKLSHLEVEGSDPIPADTTHMKRSGDTWTATLKVTDLKWKDGNTYTVRAVYVKDISQGEIDTYYNVATKVLSGKGTIFPATDRLKAGSTQTFYFIGSAGYEVDDVIVNGMHVTATDGAYTLTNIQADTLIEATFKETTTPEPKPDVYELTATTTTNGSIAPSGTTKVTEGGSLTYTITPDNGYEIERVWLDGGTDVINQMNGNTYQFQDVRANHTIHASFKKAASTATDYFVVTAKATVGGDISPAGSVRVVAGKDVPFTFTPSAGYDLDSLTVKTDGKTNTIYKSSMQNYAYTLSNVQADTEVTANFKKVESGTVVPPVPKRYKVTASASAGGTVSPQTIDANANSMHTLTFTTDAGYHLVSVTVGGTDKTSDVASDGTLAIGPVTSDIEVIATFKRDAAPDTPEYRNITSSVIDANDVIIKSTDTDIEGGTGTVSPEGNMRVPNGGTQTFSFIPDAGCEVYYIQIGNGSPKYTSALSYTLFNVVSDTDIKVAFKKAKDTEKPPTTPVLATYSIDATSTIGGYVYPQGETKVNAGRQASFTFVAHAGYALSYIQIDGATTIPATSISNKQYTFRDVQADHTLHAVFESTGRPASSFISITSSAGQGGAISPVGTTYVETGQSSTFDIAPQFGYEVKDILISGKPYAQVQGASYDASTGKLTVPYNANAGRSIDVAVTFKKKAESVNPPKEDTLVTIPVSFGKGGSASPTTLTVEKGARADITLIPNEGMDVDAVTITYPAGTSESAIRGAYPSPATVNTNASGITVTIPASKVKADGYKVSVLGDTGAKVHAAFKQAQGEVTLPTTYTVNAIANGEGYVLPTHSMTVTKGSSATFNFSSKRGYELASVALIQGRDKRDVTKDVDGAGTLTVQNVSADTLIIATFKEMPKDDPGYTGDKTHEVTVPGSVTTPGGGKVTFYPSGNIQVVEGKDLPITVDAETPHVVDKIVVTIDGEDIVVPVSGGVAVIPGDKVTGEITDIKVPTDGIHTDESTNPKPIQKFTAHAKVARGEGVVTPTDTQVASGGSVQFVFTQKEGYKVAGVTVNGKPVAFEGNSYTASAVAEDINLEVSFERDGWLGIMNIKEIGGTGDICYEVPVVKNGTKFKRYVVIPPKHKEIERVTLSSMTFEGAPVIKEENVPVFDFMSEEDERASRPGYYQATPASKNTTPQGQVFYVEDLTEERGEIYQVEVTYKDSTRTFLGQEEEGTSTISISANGSAGRSTVLPYLCESATVPSEVTIPIEPVADTANNFELVSLKVNDEDVTSQMIDGIYNLTPLAGETYNVQATFAKKGAAGQIAVHAVAGEHGQVSPNAVTVAKGGTAQFTLTPDTGYKVESVSVNGGDPIALSKDTVTYKHLNVQAETTLTFTFTELETGEKPPQIKTHTIHTLIDEAGTGTGSFNAYDPKVNEGEDYTVSFIPGDTSHVAKVVVTQNGSTQTFTGEDAPLSWTFANITSDCEVTVTFDQDPQVQEEDLYYTVDITSDEHGKLYPEGKDIKVPKGEALVVYVYPNEGYELDRFTLDGKGVVSENTRQAIYAKANDAESAASEEGALSRAVVFAASGDPSNSEANALDAQSENAPEGYVEVHSFKVEGDGTLAAAFKEKAKEPVPLVKHTITSSAGAHGKVTPEGTVEVPDGGNMTFAFTPDAGYEVSYITVNGEKKSGAYTSYTFEDVRADGTISVEFKAKSAVGAQDPVSRTLRTLTSLAQTGDIQAPAILALMSVACASLGVAVLISGRRRKESRR